MCLRDSDMELVIVETRRLRSQSARKIAAAQIGKVRVSTDMGGYVVYWDLRPRPCSGRLRTCKASDQRLPLKNWTCSRCGEIHSGMPGYSFDAPWPWFIIPEKEGVSRGTLTTDYCILRNEDFFIRAYLEIPVIDHVEPFIRGVWVSLSRQNFER